MIYLFLFYVFVCFIYISVCVHAVLAEARKREDHSGELVATIWVLETELNPGFLKSSKSQITTLPCSFNNFQIPRNKHSTVILIKIHDIST